MKMKAALLVMCCLWIAQTLPAQAILLSRATVPVGCGSFEKSLGIVETPVTTKNITAEKKRIHAELKAAGAKFTWVEVVRPGQSYAIATVQKKFNGCSWETNMWRIGKSDEDIKAAMERAIKGEAGVVSYSITKVMVLK